MFSVKSTSTLSEQNCPTAARSYGRWSGTRRKLRSTALPGLNIGRLGVVLCAALLAIIAPALAQSGQMIPVTIENVGDIEEIPFELEKLGGVSVQEFFPPEALGAVSFAVTGADGKPVNITYPKTLRPGSYSVAVSAVGSSPESFSVKIDISEPSDSYEPNDTRQTASEIKLPLRTVIQANRGADNLDWFKFSIERAYVLSVHFRNRTGGRIYFRVVDSEGKDVYKSGSSSQGARYASLAAGQYYLAVGSSGSSTTEMELALYDPVGMAGERGGFIAVGMKDGSEALEQLKIIASTTGKPLVKTLSAEKIKKELQDAVKQATIESPEKEKSSRWLVWLIVILVLALSGAGGFWMRAKLRNRDADKTAVEPPDESPDSQ